MAWALAVAFGTLTLLIPALWNGFALVFFDTGGYIDRVVEMSLYPGRSVFYGFFLWFASLGWWSFWGPITCKSILCLWVIHLTLRCHDLPSGPTSTALACAWRPFSTRKRGLSGITSNSSRNNPDGSACIQNIQRQASWPSHKGSVEAPAARASR